MPATTLDRRTALIVPDLQDGTASFPAVHPLADVVQNASILARAFRRHDRARHAHELGFNVRLGVDPMIDMNADAHANSLTRIFRRLGETGKIPESIDRLERSARP